jgi:hypothetical protein
VWPILEQYFSWAKFAGPFTGDERDALFAWMIVEQTKDEQCAEKVGPEDECAARERAAAERQDAAGEARAAAERAADPNNVVWGKRKGD